MSAPTSLKEETCLPALRAFPNTLLKGSAEVVIGMVSLYVCDCYSNIR